MRRTVFVEHFLDHYNARCRPRQIILDLHATGDPIHGSQEGRFFHGCYGHYCYLPLYIFCKGYLLAGKLRTSDIDASLGAHSGFDRGWLMKWCEDNHVEYLFAWHAMHDCSTPQPAKRLYEELALADGELARAQCHTIRTKLLKIGARVVISTQRIVVHLASGYPDQDLYQRALYRIQAAVPSHRWHLPESHQLLDRYTLNACPRSVQSVCSGPQKPHNLSLRCRCA